MAEGSDNLPTGSAVFPDVDLTGEDIEIQRLAAIKAALDPRRRKYRADILLSAAVELLATGGDRSTESLVHGLNRVWRTHSVTATEVDEVLLQAQAIGLVVKVDDLGGTPKWQASTGAVEESTRDRTWATDVLAKFRQEVAEHLVDSGIDADPPLVERAAKELLRGLAQGCRISEEVGAAFLLPIGFSIPQVRSALQTVQPESLQMALVELAEAAVDPDDSFAANIVHLMIVGSILQTFVSKRDLGQSPSLSGAHLLLDTPVLVDLMSDGSPSAIAARQCIELSVRLGGQVIVAEHTLAEWDRLWDAATTDDPSNFDDQEIPDYLDRLVASPFVAQFLKDKAGDRSLTWARFRNRQHNVRERLQQLGVIIRDAGNNRDADIAMMERMESAIQNIADDDTRPGHRSKNAARADAESAAMVSRWRTKYPMQPCGSYFVSSDFLTGLAYQEVMPDDQIPLTVRPGAWAIFAASLVADTGEEVVRLVDIVGDSLMRDSFLGLATSYTLEEASLLAHMMNESDGLTIEDSRLAVQQDLLSLLDRSAEQSPEARVAVVGGEILRRRSARRDARARRAAEHAEASLSSVSATKDGAIQGLQVRVHGLEQSSERKDKRILRLQRTILVMIGVAMIGILLAIVATAVKWSGYGLVMSCVLAGAFVLDSLRFVLKEEVRWWEPLIAGGVTACWTVAGALMGAHH